MKNKTPVNPNYYKGILPNGNEIELLDFFKAFNLNHNRSCMVKYITRADSKDNAVLDILKCIKYAIHEIKCKGINVEPLEKALKEYDKPFTTPPHDPDLDINNQLFVNKKIDEYNPDN
tara:strand:+ start:1055 stop:1408 length:354 start_codon:yes stop_codon:yes gene_type:complete